jgi:hypothetical protein
LHCGDVEYEKKREKRIGPKYAIEFFGLAVSPFLALGRSRRC